MTERSFDVHYTMRHLRQAALDGRLTPQVLKLVFDVGNVDWEAVAREFLKTPEDIAFGPRLPYLSERKTFNPLDAGFSMKEDEGETLPTP